MQWNGLNLTIDCERLLLFFKYILQLYSDPLNTTGRTLSCSLLQSERWFLSRIQNQLPSNVRDSFPMVWTFRTSAVKHYIDLQIRQRNEWWNCIFSRPPLIFKWIWASFCQITTGAYMLLKPSSIFHTQNKEN